MEGVAGVTGDSDLCFIFAIRGGGLVRYEAVERKYGALIRCKKRAVKLSYDANTLQSHRSGAPI